MQVQTQAKLINWWLIVVSLFEIVFGSIPFWDRVSFAGDWLIAAFALLIIAVLGFVTLISGVFLFKQKTWAWTVSIIMLVLVILILTNDFCHWLTSSGITFFEVIFDFHPDFLDVFYASIFLIIPVVTFILLIINRKKLLSK